MERLKWHAVHKTTHVSWFRRRGFCSESSSERGWDEEKGPRVVRSTPHTSMLGDSMEAKHTDVIWVKPKAAPMRAAFQMKFSKLLTNWLQNCKTAYGKSSKIVAVWAASCILPCTFLCLRPLLFLPWGVSLSFVPVTRKPCMTNISVAGNPH